MQKNINCWLFSGLAQLSVPFHFRSLFRDQGKFGAVNQDSGDRQITKGYRRRLGESDLLTMDKAKEGEDRSGTGKIGRFHKFPLDNKDTDRSQNQAAKDGAAPEHFQPMIENPSL